MTNKFKVSPRKGKANPDRDAKGRYFSKRLVIKYVLLAIAAFILAYTFYRMDAKFNPVEPFNPYIDSWTGSLIKPVMAVINEKEAKTVTQLIHERFGEYADNAVKVAFCESRMNRKAISPTHDYGVFQINRKTWFKKYLLDEESALFASTNIAVAYDIFKNNGYSWKAWYSSRPCHGLR